ncbi:MAG: stage II sporulation protein M [Methanobrevibacter olleyae]|uniref:Stage II sporulation protein M n=1 Tax=Methanobrevibacter olleyae TaxID=294671 RepID=A0A8T3VUS5_METOL|nr:stage II sporulation protein M [Methanobrevibacter olleyae]
MDIKHYLEIAKEETKAAFSNNKMLLLLSILLFVIPLLIGYFYADSISEYIQPMVDNFRNQVEEGTITLTTHSIFTNNVTVAFILYALGALGGVLGAIVLANNALFIGYFGADFDIIAYLILTLPHGIFEIPAIILATTGGFVLLSFILHFIWNLMSPDYSYLNLFDPYFSDVKISPKQRITAAFKKNQNKIKESFIFLCLGVIFLIIAAFIEANITLPLANWIFSLFGLGIT